jgi:hypothetical protein
MAVPVMWNGYVMLNLSMKTLILEECILDGDDCWFMLMLYVCQDFVVVFGPVEFGAPDDDWFCLGLY